MSGPDHFREAERLLEQAATQRREVRERVANYVEKRDKEREVSLADNMAAVTIAAAQVHANLAATAAYVYCNVPADHEWVEVTS